MLPFLIDVILRLMLRVDIDHIAPQMMGPKLLTNLHNLASFDYRADIGALSPEVISAIAGGTRRNAGDADNCGKDDKSALNALCLAQPRPLVAANLCASLVPETLGMVESDAFGDRSMQLGVRSLLGCAAGLSQPTDLDA